MGAGMSVLKTWNVKKLTLTLPAIPHPKTLD
jgi:hypothetical protein